MEEITRNVSHREATAYLQREPGRPSLQCLGPWLVEWRGSTDRTSLSNGYAGGTVEIDLVLLPLRFTLHLSPPK